MYLSPAPAGPPLATIVGAGCPPPLPHDWRVFAWKSSTCPPVMAPDHGAVMAKRTPADTIAHPNRMRLPSAPTWGKCITLSRLGRDGFEAMELSEGRCYPQRR